MFRTCTTSAMKREIGREDKINLAWIELVIPIIAGVV
jgi:hypothetical protein